MGYDEELAQRAQAYRAGRLSLGDLEAWVHGIDYSDPELSRLAEAACATLHLFFVEVGEGLRDQAELDELITELAEGRFEAG